MFNCIKRGEGFFAGPIINFFYRFNVLELKRF